MAKSDISITLLLIIIASIIVLSGLALLTISFYLSFEFVKTYVNSLAYSGTARFLTRKIFSNIMLQLRVISGMLVVLGSILYVSRKKIQTYIPGLLISLRESQRQIIESVKRHKPKTSFFYGLFGITLLGIVIRLFFLFQPMRYDESYTFIRFASKSLPVILSDYRFPNNHVLHTLFVYVVYHLFGNQPYILRLPAFVAGVLLVPTSYLLASMLYNQYTALLTAGFITASSIMIDYSTNARGYTLLGLIFLLTLGTGTYLKNNKNFIAWAAFVVLSALGFYTIPTMLYPFGITIIWFLLSYIMNDTTPSYDGSFIKYLTIAVFLVVLITSILYSPIFVVSGIHSVLKRAKPLSWDLFTAKFPNSMFLVWKQWHRDIPSFICVFLVIGVILSLLFHRHLAKHRIPLIVAAVVCCTPVLLIQRVTPFPRVWLFLLPIYFMSASSGMSLLFKKIKVTFTLHFSLWFIIPVIILSSLLSIRVIYTQSPATGTALKYTEEITLFLKDSLERGDRVLALDPANSPLWYYFKLHNVPLEHLFADSNYHHRVFVVVHKNSQTIEDIIDEMNLSNTLHSEFAKVLREYDFGILYEIHCQ